MSTVAQISLEQYHRMIETGCFDGKFRQRVELIRGVITKMAPIGAEHAHTLSELDDWGHAAFDQEQVQVHTTADRNRKIPKRARARFSASQAQELL